MLACIAAVAQETIDQKCIAVWEHVPLMMHALGIEIAFSGVRNEAEGIGVGRILPERSSFLKDILEKLHGFDQGGVPS